MPDLATAARAYLSALDASRTPYVQTARNAPTEQDVRDDKRRRLTLAEVELRATLDAQEADGA